MSRTTAIQFFLGLPPLLSAAGSRCQRQEFTEQIITIKGNPSERVLDKHAWPRTWKEKRDVNAKTVLGPTEKNG